MIQHATHDMPITAAASMIEQESSTELSGNELDGFDLTYGLGIIQEPQADERHGYHRGHGHHSARHRFHATHATHAPHGLHRAQGAPAAPQTSAAPLLPSLPVHSPAWAGKHPPVRLLVYQGRTVGVTNDTLEPMSYVTGVMTLLGRDKDLIRLFIPGGRGMAVANRIAILPAAAMRSLPMALRNAMPEELSNSELWVVSRKCTRDIAALTVVEGEFLRDQIGWAMLQGAELTPVG